MIPVGDSVPLRRAAWVTLTLIGANVAVYLYELWLGPRVDILIFTWGLLPSELDRWWAGSRSPTAHAPQTLLSYTFLHAGPLHLATNMLFLWIFGDNVEDRFGRLGYLAFYLLGGVVGGIAQAMASGPTAVPVIGASGAVAAVLGAYLYLYPQARVALLLVILVLVAVVQVPAAVVLGLWFLFQLLHGVAASAGSTGPGGDVGWWAHLGGFAVGLVLTPLWPKPGPAPRAVAGPVEAARWLGGAPPHAPVARALQLLLRAAQWLILGRVVLVLVHFAAPPALAVVLGLVTLVTDPLVAPFERATHPLLFGLLVLDTGALLAVIALRLVELAATALLRLVADRRGGQGAG